MTHPALVKRGKGSEAERRRLSLFLKSIHMDNGEEVTAKEKSTLCR